MLFSSGQVVMIRFSYLKVTIYFKYLGGLIRVTFRKTIDNYCLVNFCIDPVVEI